MSDIESFKNERIENIQNMKENKELCKLGNQFLIESCRHKYSYNFDWLGLPIIQFPQDIVAIQEIIWKTKPDVIVEAGVARGGSLILSASILHLLNGNGKVIGIDIDIRPHNRKAIELHPLAFRINLIEGSSIDLNTVNRVKALIHSNDRVMVILDSNHTYEHVLRELELYSGIVTKGCYLIVLDTVISEMPDDFFPDRPWGKDNHPKLAVHDFLKCNNRFEIDADFHEKLLITVAPDGYLRCVK